MKSICLALACMLVASLPSLGQLKTKVTCLSFEVDILDGKVNGLRPNATAGEVKAKFPCFTRAAGDTAQCGEAVYYLDKDVTFFTGRDYVEIGDKFKGKMTPSLLGTARGSLFNLLGHPKVKDDSWDGFQIGYGTLVLHYDKANKVRLIQFSSQTTDALRLCE